MIDRRIGDPRAPRTSASPRSARCATTGSATARRRPAPRPARPSRSSSATSTSCASGRSARVETLHAAGVTEARLYGEDPDDGIGGAGAFFLLLDEPEVYGLPPDPVVTTATCRRCGGTPRWPRSALLAGAVAAFVGGADEPGGGPQRPVDQRPGHEAVPGSQGGRRGGRRRGGGRGGRGERALDGAGRDVHVVLRPPGRQGRRRGRPTSRPTCSSAAWPPGSSLLAAGADLTGRPALRRAGRLGGAGRPSASASWRWSTTSAGPSASSTCCGWSSRPRRCRSAPGSSPRTAPLAGLAAGGRDRPAAAGLPAPCAARPAAAAWRPVPPGSAAALFAPAVASYTAVLLTDTATPAWHEAHRELPFVFVGSAAAASGGLGMVVRPARPGRPGPAARGRRGGCSSWPPSTGWSARWASPAEPLHHGHAPAG